MNEPAASESSVFSVSHRVGKEEKTGYFAEHGGVRKYTPEWEEVTYRDTLVAVRHGKETISRWQQVIFLNPQKTCALVQVSQYDESARVFYYLLAEKQGQLTVYGIGDDSGNAFPQQETQIQLSREPLEFTDTLLRIGNNFLIDKTQAKIYQINPGYPKRHMPGYLMETSPDGKTLVFMNNFLLHQIHYHTGKQLKIQYDYYRHSTDNPAIEKIEDKQRLDTFFEWQTDADGCQWLRPKPGFAYAHETDGRQPL